MKIILSRKGFDSGYGGCASPIFPDGSMASLPIPEANARHRMSNLTCGVHNLGIIARDLAPAAPQFALDDAQAVHLDPYLRSASATVPQNWTAAFGQESAAQSHLEKQGVGQGDLFLFFGWFRRVQQVNDHGRWKYVPHSPDLHVIFGWLQVGVALKVSDHHKWRNQYPWLDDHPHIQQPMPYAKNNTIYVASKQFINEWEELDCVGRAVAGGGTFDSFSDIRQLTNTDQTGLPLRRSAWKLPHWFSSKNGTGKHALTYHGNPTRWRRLPNHPAEVALQSVPKGQEFVLNLDQVDEREVSSWLNALFV